MMRRPYIIILCAALIATLPLMVNGCSCGHDFTFHLQSWLDAAEQLRHGTIFPRWAFSAAYNAGEPRFVFYPPLSWMLGALLTIVFPIAAVPAIYTFVALLAAGLAMHRLARYFGSPNSALLAAVIYTVNPYMMFTAYERTAYAELLAAAWLPLLLLAVLRKRPTIAGIALPLALLWLTNAPAAVMGSYALALIVIVRVVAGRRDGAATLRLAGAAVGGTALGLALAGFYLVPAAYERRFVQIAMAIIPNMRFQDNFLFGHTGDAPHDAVLHTASLIAVVLLVFTASALLELFFRGRKLAVEAPAGRWAMGLGPLLAILTVCVAFLLTSLSTPLWKHLPELAFLQFPWRVLSVLAVVLGVLLALVVRDPKPRAVLLLAVMFTIVGVHSFRQECDDADLPAARALLFKTHHGVEPTDEYTPTEADNDVQRPDEPAYWLARDAGDFSPGTTPNPAATDPHYSGAPDMAANVSAHPSDHFTVHSDQPEILVLNLRDYPDWEVTESIGGNVRLAQPAHIPRDDGLIAIPVAAGDITVGIHWRRNLDQQVGVALSAVALCIYLALLFIQRSRRIVD